VADSRSRLSVKIVDSTTDGQEAAVSASGHLLVDVANVSDASITVDTELTTADLDTGAGTDTRAVVGLVGSASGGGALIPGSATAGLKVDLGADNDVTVTSGNITADTELTTADLDTGGGTDTRAVVGLVGAKSGGGVLIPGDATAGLKVDLGADNDVTVTSGSITADTELPNAAALADDTANPTVPAVGSFLMGWDPTDGNWDRVKVGNDTGRLQVDVISGGGADTPTGTAVDRQTASSTAAGATATLTSASADGKKLAKIICWSSTPFKAEVFTVDNSVESSAKATGGSQAYVPWEFTPPHRSYISLGSTGGTDAFRVKMTNGDNSSAADQYATFFYSD